MRKSFAGRTVFDGVSLNLQRGDKLAVVGVNGAGKTTLLKIIAGMEQAEGTVKPGHNVILSYFGQHQAQELAGDLSILDTVYHTAVDMTITQVRSLLGAFLFTGDEVEKLVRVLSGGEKSRVALARMLVRPANLMLLDEPTNHLDMSSQEILQEAMAQYEGTIIVVSHNRFFVNSFVNKVLEIRNGRATVHEGNIDDYLEWRRGRRPAPGGGRAASRRREAGRSGRRQAPTARPSAASAPRNDRNSTGSSVPGGAKTRRPNRKSSGTNAARLNWKPSWPTRTCTATRSGGAPPAGSTARWSVTWAGLPALGRGPGRHRGHRKRTRGAGPHRSLRNQAADARRPPSPSRSTP